VAVVAPGGVTDATRTCAAAPLAPRAHPGRCPRALPPRRSHALLSAAALASFHCAALTRASRPQPSRSAITSRSASWSAAVLAFFHRVPLRRDPCGRGPCALPPRRAHALLPAATSAFFHRAARTRSPRPRPSRSSTASRSRAPPGRNQRVLPPPHSPRPSRPLPARSSPTSLPRVPVGRGPRALPPRPSPSPPPLPPASPADEIPASRHDVTALHTRGRVLREPPPRRAC
jgi:hypothetical protein